FARAAFQMYLFLSSNGKSLYFTSAIKLPIKIMESGTVIFPRLSNVFAIPLGILMGRNKIINPTNVEKVPGFKNTLLQLIVAFERENK
ncbi:hypothetical protein R0K20_13775, partial [Staphylococcus sp. SIMBA_130]